MNREEAIKYNQKLKMQLQNCSIELKENEQLGNYIVDNFIKFVPEDNVKQFAFLTQDFSVSYKILNAKLDMKKALVAGMELLASLNRPESIFNYIQLLIISVLFIGKASRQPIDKLEAYMIYWLHEHVGYQKGMLEDKVVHDFILWYQDEKGKISEEEVTDAINWLYDREIIDIENGKMLLKEKVLGRM